MSWVEIFTIIISLIALGIGALNYIRINDIDSKNEYKSKSHLLHNVLSEAKDLIKMIGSETDELNSLRIKITLSDSPYASTLGATEGDKAVLKEIQSIQTIKTSLESMCEELSGVTNLDDKQAFDRCMEIKTELKSTSIKVMKNIGQAKITINTMLELSQQQKHA